MHRQFYTGFLLLILTFRLVPGQLWISLHDHEHEKYEYPSDIRIVHERLHNCSDEMLYLLPGISESFETMILHDLPCIVISQSVSNTHTTNSCMLNDSRAPPVA